MGRTHGTDADGRPVDLIGQPIEEPVAPTAGVIAGVRVVHRQEDISMANAEKTGEYRINGNYYIVKAGDPIPEGAEAVEEVAAGAVEEVAAEAVEEVAAEVVAESDDQRAKQAAPENKSRKAAPETKSKD